MSKEKFNKLLERINYYLKLKETDNFIYDTFDIFGDDAEVYQYMKYTTNLQQENKQLKEGLHKILDLNKRAINCDSQKVTIMYLLKQYDLIYETLGKLQPGLMKGKK